MLIKLMYWVASFVQVISSTHDHLFMNEDDNPKEFRTWTEFWNLVTKITVKFNCQYSTCNSKKFKNQRSENLAYRSNTLKCSVQGCPSRIYTGIRQSFVVVTIIDLNHTHSFFIPKESDDVIVVASIFDSKGCKYFPNKYIRVIYIIETVKFNHRLKQH